MSLSLSDLIGAYKEEAPAPVAAAPEEPPSNSTSKRKGNKRKPQKDDNNDEPPKSRKRKRPERRQPKEEEKSNPEEEEEEEEVELNMEDLYNEQHDQDRTSGMEHDEFYQNYDHTLQALFQQEEPQTQISQNQKERQQQQQQQALIDKALYPVRKSKEKQDQQQQQQPKASSLGVDETGTRYSDSVAGRYQPRRKRIKIKVPTMTADGSGSAGIRSQDAPHRMETAQEVEARVDKLETKMERSKRIQMYKRRTMNHQEEEDVGNAFAERANKYLAEDLRREKRARLKQEAKEKRRKAKERRKQELEEAKERERMDLLEEDDSVREQSQLLAQLSQSNVVSSSQPEDEEDQANKDGGLVTSPIKDYWQQGYTVPRPEDIGYKYNPSMKEIVEQTSMDVTSSDDDNDGDDKGNREAKATYPQLMLVPSSNFAERFYFPPNRVIINNSGGAIRAGYRLTNALQFLAMASRALCGTSSDSANLENRYMRLLCSHTHGNRNREEDLTFAHYQMSHFARIIAEEQGQNMYLYLRHTWNDAANVTRTLGLLDTHEENPVTGSMLTRVHFNWRETRGRVSKAWKKAPKEWSYESAPDQDREKEHAGAEDESLRTGNTIPDGVTSRGVLDVVTHISAASAAIIDRKMIARLSYEARGALVGATCLYSHVQGTSPPVPQFPLDPTKVIFGPVDKHANFYHSSVRMDRSTYKIILSKLMARVAKGKLSNDRAALTKAQTELSKLVAEYVVINKNDFYKLYVQQFDLPEYDIPLVEFYRGVSEFCSFTANGCASQNDKLFHREDRKSLKTEDIQADDNEGDNVDCLYSSLLLHDSGMKEVAERIWKCCQTHINHNGLLRFPKLRVTSAIALICRSLPASAAEILSRPLDDCGDSTPIHLFKRTLEHMEEKKMIFDALDFYDENAVRAAEIEYIMHDASEMFQVAVKVDPTNVDYHLWHIGCLSACLLISSGNRISSQAHLYPSQKRDSIGFHQGPRHEVRVKLKKYSEVRFEVAMSVRTLLTLARYQQSAKTHFAVVTVLGWSQIVGLLVGSPMQDFKDDIANLYSFHVRHWLKRDTSPFAMDMWKKQTDAVDDAVICARNVENNPEDISHWRNLVRCLGPVGTDKTASRSEIWWGKGREWWEDSILSIMVPRTTPKKKEAGTTACVLDRLKREEGSAIVSLKNSMAGLSANESQFYDRWLHWLPTKVDTQIQDEEQDNVSDEIRSICYSSKLPCMIQNDTEAAPSLDLRLAWLSNDELPEVSSTLKEIHAYKVLLLCHLFGSKHPKVVDCIYHSFVLCCWENVYRKLMKDQCDELTLLRWLRAMGLDLDVILKGRVPKKGGPVYTIVDPNDQSETDQPEIEQPTTTDRPLSPPPMIQSPSANNRRRQRRAEPVAAQRSRATRSDSVDFWSSLKVPPISNAEPSTNVAASGVTDNNSRRQRNRPSSTENDSRRQRPASGNDERRQRRPPSRTENDSRRERNPPAGTDNDSQQQHEGDNSASNAKRRRVEPLESQRKRPATLSSSTTATTGLYDLLQSHRAQNESHKRDEFDVLNKRVVETVDHRNVS